MAEIDCHEHCLTSWYLGLKERFNPAIDVLAVSAYATAVCAVQLFRISLWATLLLSEQARVDTELLTKMFLAAEGSRVAG